MKVLILLGLVAAACAYNVQEPNTDVPYSIIADRLIPLGEAIRKAEEKMASQRIVGGAEAILGQFPYQVGLAISFANLDGTGVCGGSLISAERILTAAHCWFDGVNQGSIITAVLGSLRLFSGGVRIDTSVVVAHDNWTPSLIRNDVAIIYLPSAVAFTPHISPVALPSGSELQESFSGIIAAVSGFGLTSDDGSITQQQSKSFVHVQTISNTRCSLSFPLVIQESNICTDSSSSGGPCRGDSGGPLTVMRSGRPIVIGVVSFGSARGCEVTSAAYARVTSFMDFINQHI